MNTQHYMAALAVEVQSSSDEESVASEASVPVIRLPKHSSVKFHTPVMTCQAECRMVYTPFTLLYEKNELLHAWENPVRDPPHRPLYIELQEGDVRQQLDKLVRLDQMLSDTHMIEFIDRWLDEIRGRGRDAEPAGIQKAEEAGPLLTKLWTQAKRQNVELVPPQSKHIERARTKYDIRAAEEAGQREYVQRMAGLRRHGDGRRLYSDRKIAHDLGIAKHRVQYLRHPRPGKPRARPPLSKRPELIARVAEYIRSAGFEALTMGKVRQHLADSGFSPLPSLATIGIVVRERLGLSYRVRKTINFRFLSTAFDEKRIWVTRLIVMFIRMNMLLVCVDESSFQAHNYRSRHWVPRTRFLRDHQRELYRPEQPPCHDDMALPAQHGGLLHPQRPLAGLGDEHGDVQVQSPLIQRANSPYSAQSTPLASHMQRLRLDDQRGDCSLAVESDSGSEQPKQPSNRNERHADGRAHSQPAAQHRGPDAKRQHELAEEIRRLPLEMVQAHRNHMRKAVQHSSSTLCLVTAVSQIGIHGSQIIEGSNDRVTFENFFFQLLRSLRTQPRTCERQIVMVMDNATVHKHEMIRAVAAHFNVNVLFLAEYSPWLNPCEQVFNAMKRRLRDVQQQSTRLEMVAFIQQQLVELDCEARAATLWGYPLHAMRETLALGKYLSF